MSRSQKGFNEHSLLWRTHFPSVLVSWPCRFPEGCWISSCLLASYKITVSFQHISSGAEGGVRLMESQMRRTWKGGSRRRPHQLLPVPQLHVPGHNVPLPVQPDAGVPRRADLPHAHAHSQGDAEPGQLQQVSLCPSPVFPRRQETCVDLIAFIFSRADTDARGGWGDAQSNRPEIEAHSFDGSGVDCHSPTGASRLWLICFRLYTLLTSLCPRRRGGAGKPSSIQPYVRPRGGGVYPKPVKNRWREFCVM